MRNVMRNLGRTRGFATRKARLGLMALALGITGTGMATTVTKSEGASTKESKQKRSWYQVGKASWYGGHFNGRKTALGEKFDMHALTCAHRTLPLGSWIRVTNLHNKRAVFLRVNDRGPMSESLIVDLSYGAAQKLGINGVGSVKLEAVRKDDPALIAALAGHRPLEDQPSGGYTEIASNADGFPVLSPIVALR